MATAEQPLAGLVRPQAAVSTELADQWRRLTRAATVVALLTSPALFIWFKQYNGWSTLWSLLATLGVVIVFRGFADLLFRKLIPWPSLFGADSQQLRDEDVIGRRRAWYWRKKARFAIVFGTVITVVWLIRGGTWWGTVVDMIEGLLSAFSNPAVLTQVVFVTFLFIANFAILMGPMLLMGISQIRGFEPGDAQWGVKLEDVRGQVEAKEEVRRVVTLWQSGEAFERAGGKRERGLLFLGAPGTGKTMLAKAIATGFNSPFVSIPGSGFAQTFIGVDAIVVRYLAWKAKRLARKWGGQCIVFIDEIDAVGMRRQALGGGAPAGAFAPADIHDHLFFGPSGALTGSGDLILETRRWRERMFELRAPERLGPSGLQTRIASALNFTFPGMGGGTGLALNQLLVVMDGIDNPPFTKRVLTSRFNTFLDATYIVPRRLGKIQLRLAPPGPRGDQIYFIGADERPARPARSRTDPARSHGPPRLVPDADEAGPARRLRPLHHEGRARVRARHAPATRRDRADHERLLAGDDRPGLLDGADHRPPRRSRPVRLGGPRRGDDHDRVGNCDRDRVHRLRDPCGRDPRGGSRGGRARLHEGRRVDPPLDPHARRLARPSPGTREGRALQPLPLRRDGTARLDARRDGGRAGLLRRELERRRRRRAIRDRSGGVDGRRVRDGSRAVRGDAARRRERGRRPRSAC